MNHAVFAGRLGRDAEVKYTTSGKAVCNFNIAVDVGFGDKKKTLWVQGTLWEEKAEKLAQYLTKGKMVVIAGPVDARAYVNNQQVACAQLSVNVRELTFGGGGEKSEGHEQQEPASAPAQSPGISQPISDEDIPF